MAKYFTLLVGLICCFATVANGSERRIVSAGGSVTEIIYALGKGGLVVATDSTSAYPPEANNTVKLGYFRQLSSEGVLAQHPTDLFAAQATGPDTMLQQVAAAGVNVLKVNEKRDLHGLLDMVSRLGSALDAEQAATDLKQHILQQVELVTTQVRQSGLGQVNALYVVANNDRGLTVAGQDTVPQALFDLLGFQNVAADLTGYKLMDTESVVMANPDIVYVAGHMLYGQQMLDAMCQHPAIKPTKAGHGCHVTPLSSATSLGLSPRFALAMQQMLDAVTAARSQEQD